MGVPVGAGPVAEPLAALGGAETREADDPESPLRLAETDASFARAEFLGFGGEVLWALDDAASEDFGECFAADEETPILSAEPETPELELGVELEGRAETEEVRELDVPFAALDWYAL